MEGCEPAPRESSMTGFRLSIEKGSDSAEPAVSGFLTWEMPSTLRSLNGLVQRARSAHFLLKSF
jgi:hypothetical protein